MSDKKISQLTAATTADGTEPLPIVQSGETKKATGKVVVSGAVSDLAQTWNAAGTTFTGLKLNVTDTASASGSKLLDVQKGGTSQLVLDKNGNFGIGAVPSTNWGTNYKVFQLGNGGQGFAGISRTALMFGNVYADNSNYRYFSSTKAALYECDGINGLHKFSTAPDGVGGSAISFLERISIGQSAAVFNDPGNDYDFRVEGDTDANLLFVDASADAIGVGTTSLPSKFNVAGSITVAQNVSFTGVNALLGNLTGDNASAINFVSGASSNTRSGIALKDSWTGVNNTGGYVSVYVGNGSGNTEAFRASNTGIVFNEAGADYDFRIEGDTDANLFFVDASTDRVGIGTNAPADTLHIAGTARISKSDTPILNWYVGSTRAGYVYSNSGTKFIVESDGRPLYLGASANQQIELFVGGTERARVDKDGNVVINNAAIATNATNGFLYVPSCAGTPTGTPTAYTGRVPIVVDSTNNKLYFYSGGQWRDAGP